jgi:hypothetical protein
MRVIVIDAGVEYNNSEVIMVMLYTMNSTVQSGNIHIRTRQDQ